MFYSIPFLQAGENENTCNMASMKMNTYNSFPDFYVVAVDKSLSSVIRCWNHAAMQNCKEFDVKNINTAAVYESSGKNKIVTSYQTSGIISCMQ